jgi:hypothetical protein
MVSHLVVNTAALLLALAVLGVTELGDKSGVLIHGFAYPVQHVQHFERVSDFVLHDLVLHDLVQMCWTRDCELGYHSLNLGRKALQ